MQILWVWLNINCIKNETNKVNEMKKDEKDDEDENDSKSERFSKVIDLMFFAIIIIAMVFMKRFESKGMLFR